MPEKLYMIVGVTKHGKTTFLNKTLGTNLRADFNDGKSVTVEVTPISVTNNCIFSNSVIFDTPGLPDSSRQDGEVANQIIQGLLKYKAHGALDLHGIIFIQRLGEFFNLSQYNSLLGSLSGEFKMENFLLVISKVNSCDPDEQQDLINDSIRMCQINGINNYVFWDSKRAFTFNGKSQEINLIDALKNLKAFRMDKLEEFDMLVNKKAKEIQESKKIIKLKPVTKQIPSTRAVIIDKDSYETYYHQEWLDFSDKLWAYTQKHEIIIDLKLKDPNFYERYEWRSAPDVCTCSNLEFEDPTFSGYVDFKRIYEKGDTDNINRYRIETKGFINRDNWRRLLPFKVKFWARFNYIRRISTQTIQNCMVDYETVEPCEEFQNLEKFIEEAKELVLNSFIKK